MFEAMMTYPDFTLFGLTALYLLVQSLRACRKYRSWLPLFITLGVIVGLMLLGFLVGLLVRPLFT